MAVQADAGPVPRSLEQRFGCVSAVTIWEHQIWSGTASMISSRMAR